MRPWSSKASAAALAIDVPLKNVEYFSVAPSSEMMTRCASGQIVLGVPVVCIGSFKGKSSLLVLYPVRISDRSRRHLTAQNVSKPAPPKKVENNSIPSGETLVMKPSAPSAFRACNGLTAGKSALRVFPTTYEFPASSDVSPPKNSESDPPK